MVEKISREGLKNLYDSGSDFIVAEALPASYHVEEHLPGAINLPHDQVDSLAAELLPDKSAHIVVYCSNGPCANSGIASNRLHELGYTNVRDYHEGKQDWISAGLPIEGRRAG